MNIGDPVRIIEVEPLWLPLPDAVPTPVEPTLREPAAPAPEPRVPAHRC